MISSTSYARALPERLIATRSTTSPASAAGSVLGRAETLSASLPPLLVAAERVALTVAQGIHGRRQVGQGESFWEFRRYQPGDAVHRIDWRRSARSDNVYIRQTEWEAAQSVWLWRDCSASMAYSSESAISSKREHADILLLALSSLLSRGGERFALLSDGGVPAAGRPAFRRLSEVITKTGSEGDNLPPLEPLPRYGHLILVGDFLSPLEEIWGTLQAFAGRGVSGHLVRIIDPAEEMFPFSGRLLLQGCEGEGDMLFGRADTVAADYREAFTAHSNGLLAMANAIGWPLIIHRTNKPLQSTLLALYLRLSETIGR